MTCGLYIYIGSTSRRDAKYIYRARKIRERAALKNHVQRGAAAILLLRIIAPRIKAALTTAMPGNPPKRPAD